MTLPTFSGLSELQDDMSNVTASWTMYKEYSEELNNMGQQDWITFRSTNTNQKCGTTGHLNNSRNPHQMSQSIVK